MSSSYDSALVDTAMIEDPRLLALPRGARLLHLEALVWCKARLTDGYLPAGALPRMTDEPDAPQAAEQLVSRGLWSTAGDGWQILGFTDTQMSADRVREKRLAARERYDKWQSSQSQPKRVSKRVTNGAANDPARPAPPARKGRGQVGGKRADSGEPTAPVVPLPSKDEQLRRRRTLAQSIRDAPDDLLRKRYRRTFDREYGQLYGRERSA